MCPPKRNSRYGYYYYIIEKCDPSNFGLYEERELLDIFSDNKKQTCNERGAGKQNESEIDT